MTKSEELTKLFEGNKERDGTDITQDDVDRVFSNIKKFKDWKDSYYAKYMKLAQNTSDMRKKHEYENLAYYPSELAIRKTMAFWKKESSHIQTGGMDPSVTSSELESVGGISPFNTELIKGLNIDLNKYKDVKELMQSVNSGSAGISKGRQNPEDIIGFDSLIREIYRILDQRDQESRVKAHKLANHHQKVMTLYLLDAEIHADLYDYKLPFFDEMSKVKEAYPNKIIKGLESIGISERRFRTITPNIKDALLTVMDKTEEEVNTGVLRRKFTEGGPTLQSKVFRKLEDGMKDGKLKLSKDELIYAIPLLVHSNRRLKTSAYAKVIKTIGTIPDKDKVQGYANAILSRLKENKIQSLIGELLITLELHFMITEGLTTILFENYFNRFSS